MADTTDTDAKKPWKHNILRIPDSILAQVEGFTSNALFASCAKRLRIEDIRTGLYDHLGIRYEDNKIVFPEEKVPFATIGKYSRWNRPQGRADVLQIMVD